ncbi:MAG: dihydrodipicolinate synthase family protein [Spirochaetales bacterium]
MRKELLNLRGIITVLNTPFTEKDEIDLESLRKNVLRAMRAGVVGFLVPALAGEVGKLTLQERVGLVDTVIQTVRHREDANANTPRTLVIGGATAQDPLERVRAAEALIELGCDGILVSLPYSSDESYLRGVNEIASLKPGFLMLQDWDPTGYGLPVPLIKRLFEEVEAFRCLKIETIPAGVKYTEVLQATGGKLHVSGGWAVSQMIEGLDRGIHAFMPTGLHEIYCEIYRRYSSGHRPEAMDLFRKILPVLAFSNQHLDISIHFFKRLLYREGTYATPRVRQPILPFDSYHQRIADELIEYVLELTFLLNE